MAAERLGDGVDYRDLIVKVVTRLRERGETLGLAESCTGGLLSSWVTALSGVSDVYIGGIVAYANQVKEDFLKVRRSTLIASGAVSLATAEEMAAGARAALGVDWALSITGIAGPEGGTAQKPVGTVCFGLAGPGLEASSVEVEIQRFDGDRRGIQAASAFHALEMLWRRLEKSSSNVAKQIGP